MISKFQLFNNKKRNKITMILGTLFYSDRVTV